MPPLRPPPLLIPGSLRVEQEDVQLVGWPETTKRGEDKKRCNTSMHKDKVDMPWDGALPMLRHERLQLKVIAFPVPPPLSLSFLFFPLYSSLLLLFFPGFLFFTKRRVSPSSRPVPACSYSLLAFNRPPSLCLTPRLLLLPPPGTSSPRWLWSSKRWGFDSTARA